MDASAGICLALSPCTLPSVPRQDQVPSGRRDISGGPHGSVGIRVAEAGLRVRALHGGRPAIAGKESTAQTSPPLLFFARGTAASLTLTPPLAAALQPGRHGTGGDGWLRHQNFI